MGPGGVDIAVHGQESSCSGIRWYPCLRSNTAKMRFFRCFYKMESISGNEHELCSLCSLNPL